MVIGFAAITLCAWCGWVSGYHRTTGAAETTWLVTVVAVMLVDVALWRGRTGRRLGWRLEPVGDPWPREGRGGSRPALRSVAPWLALIVVVLAWEVLGIDTGPHQYHLTIQRAGPGLPAAERRPPSRVGARRDRLRGSTCAGAVQPRVGIG